jgi:hypothetical protein
MSELSYTLVSDGSSNRALLPILSWLLREHRVLCPIQAEWADLQRLPNSPSDLASRIQNSLELYPCNLLFVHRDAERLSYQQRKDEIKKALAEISSTKTLPVCVVPVRMQEAWLLFNEPAIRRAAGNPHGQTSLDLPPLSRLEQLNNPKNALYNLLKNASELSGRRLRRFDVRQSAVRVAEYIDDFSQLRSLPAFRALEADIENTVTMNQWAAPL